MLTESILMVENSVELPTVAGLAFRAFRGDADFEAMAAIIMGSREADGVERVISVDDLRRDYSHLVNSDPHTDMIFVEINGRPIGYARVWWQQVENGPRAYGHFAQLLPEWRGLGIRTTLVQRNEERLREIAATHAGVTERCYECWASAGEAHWIELLERRGYVGARFGFDMVRPTL